MAAAILQSVHSLRHSFHITDGHPLIGPVGVPFGFLDTGYYELTVSNFALRSTSPGTTELDLAKVEAGFFLQRFDNQADFNHHMDELLTNRSACAFGHFLNEQDDDFVADDDYSSVGPEFSSADEGILLPFRGSYKGPSKTIQYSFKKGEAGLYFLVFQVCPYKPAVRAAFELDFHFMNYDSFGTQSYLSAGEIKLPLIFFFFSVSYLFCLVVWVLNNHRIRQGKPGICGSPVQGQGRGQAIVHPIHHLMSALVLFKFLATLFESFRYHAIKLTGHAEMLSVVYYIFTFIKGTFLFTVILLIGTGWSFVKPFLNDREKKVVVVVLGFQVVNNIALIVLSQLTEGEDWYQDWLSILHIVDILCCCAVLIPIVWQVNALEKSIVNDDEEESEMDDEREMERDGEKAQILRKLRLFRSFYLLVIAYIYATRILVYLFATMLPYQLLWVKFFVTETVTLTFYIVVGMMFRPMAENPYLSVKQRTDTAIELVEHDD